MFISNIMNPFPHNALSPMLQRIQVKVASMTGHKAVLRRGGFTFKQFFVAHDRCAMKVGTDGVLLGAWAPVAGVKRILDIGTGSGLLALMLAQRTHGHAFIDAVEIDNAAAIQARENAAASPWADKITVHQSDIKQWHLQHTERYELIVSNPPYFDKGVSCATPEREHARYTTQLDHSSLLQCAADRITEQGFFCVVLPESIGQAFVLQAEQQGWHCRFRANITEHEGKPPHRVLLGLSPSAGEFFAEQIVIRGPDQRYSEAYTGLTQDFYLFM